MKKEPSHQEIADRAYELWQAQGCAPARDVEHWLEAERMLRAELEAPKAAAVGDRPLIRAGGVRPLRRGKETGP